MKISKSQYKHLLLSTVGLTYGLAFAPVYAHAATGDVVTVSGATTGATTAATTVSAVMADDKELEEIIVSGLYKNRNKKDTVMGVSILSKEKLSRSLDATLGETLKNLPGVSSSFFGPGASRPIIRGLGGVRALMLDNGLGSIDASSTSPDHAVAVEPAQASRIEILRGTATLAYGSAAAGGAVNVIDGRIPTTAADRLTGAVRAGYTHNTRGVNGAVNLTGNLWKDDDKALVFYLDAQGRDQGNYRIPGFAETELFHELEEAEHGHEEAHDDDDHGDEHEERSREEGYGILENSFMNTQAFSAGLSYISHYGFLGFNVKKLNTKYGIAAGHAHGEEEEGHEDEHEDEDEHGHEDENVRIDLDQIRVDVMGQLRIEDSWIKELDFRFGYADYDHTELEGDEIGTVFTNKGYEGRLEVAESFSNAVSGRSGITYKEREYSAIGEEAFVPAVDSSEFGLFTMKEWTSGPVRLDFGARYEHVNYSLDGPANSGFFGNASLDEQSFDSFSISSSAGYDLSSSLSVGGTVHRTERAPALEELYSFGPHLATNSYEIGDPSFDKEEATGAELTAIYQKDGVYAQVNAFYTYYDGFIFNNPIGQERDELPVFKYFQRDVTMRGFEAEAEFDLGMVSDFEVHLHGQIDYVRFKRQSGTDNRNLPQIPPLSGLVALEAENEVWRFRLEADMAADQNKIAEDELPTDGYALMNAYVSYKPFKDKDLSVDLKVLNMFDTDARQHTSVLKDRLPQPGRDIRLNVRFGF